MTLRLGSIVKYGSSTYRVCYSTSDQKLYLMNPLFETLKYGVHRSPDKRMDPIAEWELAQMITGDHHADVSFLTDQYDQLCFPNVTYSIGQKFKWDKDEEEYLLAGISPSTVSLIRIKDGMRFNDGFEIGFKTSFDKVPAKVIPVGFTLIKD